MLPNNLKSFLRDYFTLTSRERKGAMVLATIIIMQIAIIIFLNYTVPPFEPAVEQYRVQIAQFEAGIRSSDTITDNPREKRKEWNHDIKLYPFNPNFISDKEWMNFGLSKKQTAIVRNYLGKGGVFRKKEDVAKIFGITKEQYNRMEPYITIPEEKKRETNRYTQPDHLKKEHEKININTADTIELDKLPMVGEGRARLIYRYREALGGFVSAEQLLEVYSIDSAVFEAIKPLILVDENHIRKLNMNSDTLQHPYLSYKIAGVIKSYRKQHGKFEGPEDLRKIQLMNNEVLNKLAPYMVFE